ncbi:MULTISPECIES: UDP-3-O-(3-hydroxymyristoyl)glucosamine N-acyltransferase [Gammaproteobacteria]|uniref:UDP-3-O-(3-hydroxymyristoyl)glucosamine N-acyltransferase n=1 Tax=Gammaproteobacteria TaxID=1236 RepID=UPI000DCF9A02|nr:MULTISPECIES: UDP-3-O-(3-hydroxymyristoyl)glucosamine N-acyltransferase [Gammaproteobacteria]RTE87003.1 UDP-3-O-(3-hydroxymyristoyl)glucosamine N-acyltransferase [Aliidiomarina sp. B3213]TCZ93207.1 UDP-3-O-(3-hydroxymyristoyl)glucosamine N-acyltransferase [Lysobacter sp. N42]
MKPVSIATLASAIDAEVSGAAETEVHGLATLAAATPQQVSFLANPKYQSQLETTQAGAIIAHPEVAKAFPDRNFILSDNPYLSYAKAAQFFDLSPRPPVGIHPTAVVSESAQLGEGVAVGPHAVIADDAVIGAGTSIGANCYIGENARLGDNCRLWPQVSIYYGVVIGSDCTFHSGAVIGADGFGFAPHQGSWVKIPQLGSVEIGDRVEIGANTTVDRGALDNTVIESGCIIDNHCMIAHNVHIGANTAMAAHTGIAGSTTIGKNCLFAGYTGIAGHINICDGVRTNGMTMITRDIKKPGVLASGLPEMEHSVWSRASVRFKQLPELFSRVRALEKNNK